MKRINITDLRPLEDPGDGWYHIEANGEHPGVMVEEGKEREFIQVLDDVAIARIVENGVPEEGLLIDKDHLSHSPEVDTAAYGWVRDLAAFEDAEGKLQLAGKIQWTDLGRPLAKGKIYKHWSSEYGIEDAETEDLGEGRLRWGKLLGLALTNRPNNKGQRPVTNSCDRRAKTQNNNTHTNMEPLEQIKQKLGLDAEATLEDVLAELEALQSASDAAAESEAETLLNSEGLADLSDEEKKDLKEELVHNRELGLKMIKIIKNRQSPAGQPSSPRYANPGSRKSAPVLNKNAEGKDKATGLVNRAREIQKDARIMNRKMSFWKAFGLAKGEKK